MFFLSQPIKKIDATGHDMLVFSDWYMLFLNKCHLERTVSNDRRKTIMTARVYCVLVLCANMLGI